jgi:Protein of unknown function (DUF3108)
MALRRFTRPFILSSLAAAALGSAPAPAETIDVKYALSLIGLPIGVAEAEATVDASEYSIRINAKLVGVAALVSTAKTAATASGSILQGRVAPESYAATSANSHSTRTVRMAMDEGSVRALSIVPPMREEPGRVPVTDDQKRNIVDPVSALAMTIPTDAPGVGAAACDRTLRIFDGYTRFDIKLSFAGVRRLKVHGYDGMVSACAARYVPISGHKPGAPGVVFLQNDKQLEIWLAPLDDARVELPVRISIETMVGTTVVEATDFSIHRATAGSQAVQ